MKSKNLKLFFTMLVAVLLVINLTGCSEEQSPTDSSPGEGQEEISEDDSSTKDSIIIATSNEPSSLHPYDHEDFVIIYMNLLNYNTLFRGDPDTLEPVPYLVDSYEAVSDTEYVFKLKENIKFHNGETMTSEDVKASLEYASTFAAVQAKTSFWDNIEIIDDLTFKMTTPEPSAAALYYLADTHANIIVPKSLIEANHDFYADPVGSGPYKYVKWDRGEKIEFVKFDEYWDADNMPTITNLTYKFIPEDSARTIALETGDVDFVFEVPTIDLNKLEENEEIEVVKKPSATVHNFRMNNEKYPFNNKKFRMAISAAINREDCLTVAMDGIGQVTLGQTSPIHAGYSEANAITYNPELAKQYLEESGIDVTSLDPIICIVSTSRTEYTKAAQVIQQNLAELGITMNIEQMEYVQYKDLIDNTDYDVGVGALGSSSMLSNINNAWHSKGSFNEPRARFPEIDALIELATTQIDEAERTATIKTISEMLNAECPTVPLYQTVLIRAFNSNLEGVTVTPDFGLVYFNEVYWK